jgi:rubrerythrin
MSQLSIEAILNKAIEREVEAYEFYLALSQKNLDAYVKEIFAELAAEEKGHQTLLQSFLNNPDKPLRFKPSADFKVAQTVDGPTLSLDMKPVEIYYFRFDCRSESDFLQ